MTRYIDDLFNIADVTGSEADNGEIRVNLGDAVSGAGIASDTVLYGIDGFVARPNDPSADGAAQAVWFYNGNQKVAIASRDNRFAEKGGALKPGDRAIVSDTPARIMIKREQDAVVLYTEQDLGGSGGKHSMMVLLDGKNGKLQLVNGAAILEVHKTKVVMAVDGGGSLTIDGDGITMTGARFTCACGGGTLGVMPGGLAPPTPSNAMIYGLSGQSGVPSTTWTVAV